MHDLIAEISQYQGSPAHMGDLAQLAGIATSEEATLAYRVACSRVVEAISRTAGTPEVRAALMAEANAFQYAARADPTMFFREVGPDNVDELVRIIFPADPAEAARFMSLGGLHPQQAAVVMRATVGVAMAMTVRLAEPKIELPSNSATWH